MLSEARTLFLLDQGSNPKLSQLCTFDRFKVTSVFPSWKLAETLTHEAVGPLPSATRSCFGLAHTHVLLFYAGQDTDPGDGATTVGCLLQQLPLSSQSLQTSPRGNLIYSGAA